MSKIKEEFQQLLAGLASTQGVDQLTSSIFSILYTSKEEVSLDELSKLTGYSLASISTKMKFLEGSSLIQRISKPRSKKAFFYMEKDMTKILKRQLMAKERLVFKTVKEKLPEILKRHENTTDKDTYRLAKDYYNTVIKMEKIVKEILERI